MPVKSENPSGWLTRWFWEFFLSFSLKAHNYYAMYHTGADFSNWKVPALWNSNSLHENVLWCGQCYNLLCKGSAYFDHPGYWMSAICLAKLWKNCRIIGLNRAKKNKFCPRSVWLKKGLIVLFTWDVMRKSMFKRLVYTPSVSSPRFTCKANLSNTRNPAWFFILAALLDRGMQCVNWLPPRTIVARVFLQIIFRGCPIIQRDWWMPLKQ